MKCLLLMCKCTHFISIMLSKHLSRLGHLDVFLSVYGLKVIIKISQNSGIIINIIKGNSMYRCATCSHNFGANCLIIAWVCSFHYTEFIHRTRGVCLLNTTYAPLPTCLVQKQCLKFMAHCPMHLTSNLKTCNFIFDLWPWRMTLTFAMLCYKCAALNNTHA